MPNRILLNELSANSLLQMESKPTYDNNTHLIYLEHDEAIITAYAGPDDQVCITIMYGDGYSLSSATATNYTSLKWTSDNENGAFVDDTVLNAIYYGDIGTHNLTLSAITISNVAKDTMTLIVNPIPENVSTPIGDTYICLTYTSASTYTTSIDNALTYDWELTPTSAGTINEQGSGATITWSQIYSGVSYLKDKGINDCGICVPSWNLVSFKLSASHSWVPMHIVL